MGPARNYVVYTTRCNSTFVLSRPWAMSLLVHSSPSYWSSNWTRTPCLSGNDIVRGQLTFLTSPIKLLEFMNLRAQASETSLSNHKGSSRGVNPSDRKSHHPPSQLLPSLPMQILPLIAFSVEQASIHSTPAQCSNLSLTR